MIVRNAWYVAAWADEVTDAPLARRICGEPIVLFRDTETGLAGALADFCCHRGAPLSTGRCVPGGIECGYHGMQYRRRRALHPHSRTSSHPHQSADPELSADRARRRLVDVDGRSGVG